jgi:hypothetical protein
MRSIARPAEFALWGKKRRASLPLPMQRFGITASL